jgi:hypothetical protein
MKIRTREECVLLAVQAQAAGTELTPHTLELNLMRFRHIALLWILWKKGVLLRVCLREYYQAQSDIVEMSKLTDSYMSWIWDS